MNFKRFAALFAVFIVIGTFFSSFAFAQETKKSNLVALGDSITYGWNLDPKNPKPSSLAFPNLIGNGQFYVTNLGIPGWTSKNLLDALNTKQEFSAALKNADMITLDIGSNDLLQSAGLAEIVKNHQPVSITPDLEAKLADASKLLSFNLQEIIKKIRSETDAPIFLYNLYNPFGASQDPFAASLHALGEQIITSVNTKVIQPITAATSSVYIDAYSAFNGLQNDYILPGDIHPNEAGQRILAEQANKALASLPLDASIQLTPADQTAGPVTIQVSSSLKGILQMKWLPGDKNAADFTEAGNPIVDGKFQVTANGTYSIYLLDSTEKTTVKKITISNIQPAQSNPATPVTGTPVSTPKPTVPAPASQPKPTPVTVPANQTGHPLPNTATPIYNDLALGAGFIIAGMVLFAIQNKRTKRQKSA